MTVVMAGRDAVALERARHMLEGAQTRTVVVPMDVTNPTSIAAAERVVTDRVGGVDVLVNNAAVLLAENDEIVAIPPSDYRDTFDTNVFGAIEVCRTFVPEMARRRYGRVVNVSSGAGQLTSMSTYAPAYSMSKAALNAFTRILASTLSRRRRACERRHPRLGPHRYGRLVGPALTPGGADTIVWLATLPDDGPTGGFFRDRRAIGW